MGQTRRNFLKTAAAAAGGIALGSQTVVAKGVLENQFFVDTDSSDSDLWRQDVEIIDEAEATGFASVNAEESDLEGYGLDFAREIEYEISPPDVPEGAPALTEDAEPDVPSPEAHEGSGTPAPYPLQWDKEAQNVRALHEEGITGDGATVAIIDSGIDADHPDLEANVNTDKSANFSTADGIGARGEYHGTHVAGIVAASGDNASSGGPYVVGNAPDAELVDLKIFPFKSSASIISAVEHAILSADADVANMSFGPANPYGPSVDSHLSEKAYRQLGELAVENGTLLVESAGNADANIDAVPETVTNTGKGTVEGFLEVSATGPVSNPSNLPEFGTIAPTHAPAYYTNYGPESIDVSAAGGNVLGTDFDGVLSTMPPEAAGGFTRIGPNSEYGTLHGTSMAAPNVAGTAALIAAENPDASPKQIRYLLKNTATELDVEYPDIFGIFGIGLGYFESTNGTIFNDFELEDPYTSQRYRGDGHIDVTEAVEKGVPDALEGGIQVEGTTYYPTDPDNDGLYEDVNGDGVVDMEDVELLYQIALRNVVGPDTEAFDFNGDGRFDMYDVQQLVREIQ